jgi:hypothetical protein
MYGGVESTTEKVAILSTAFPHWSVTIKLTVAEEMQELTFVRVLKLFDHDTVEHVSLAKPPPSVVSQVFKSTTFPVPSHSTDSLAGGVTTVGN